MIANPNPPDFFVPTAYLQSAITHSEGAMTDPHCQEFIEAIADVLVYLGQQRENPRGQQADQAQG